MVYFETMEAEEEAGSTESVVDTLFNSAARDADVVSPHGVLNIHCSTVSKSCLL